MTEVLKLKRDSIGKQCDVHAWNIVIYAAWLSTHDITDSKNHPCNAILTEPAALFIQEERNFLLQSTPLSGFDKAMEFYASYEQVSVVHPSGWPDVK